MKRDLRLEAVYPHPPEKVWRALSSAEAMSEWLMPNDFQPVVGHAFTFRTQPAPGFDGIVHCEVLEVDPPRRLAFTWRGGPIDTVLTFQLEPEGEGTRLVVTQTGFRGLKAVLVSFILGSGNRTIYRRKLPAHLDREAAPDRAVIDEACHNQGAWRALILLFTPIFGRKPGSRK